MRTLLASLLTLAAASAGTLIPHLSMAAPICGKAACIEAPNLDQRLALVAYLARQPAAATSCDAVARAGRVGCAVLDGMMADAKRAARFASMAKTWSHAQRTLFAELLAAEQTFAKAVGAHEIDRMASSSGIDAIDARQSENEAFARSLERIAARPALHPTFVAFADADGALNAAYTRVMVSEDTTSLAWGTVEKAGIRRTQRAWLAYRDVFVSFAATLGADTEALKSEMTQRRTVSLEGFLQD